jgi:hypothetical protein
MKTAGFLDMMLSSLIDEVDPTLMETAGSSEMLICIYQTVVLHPSGTVKFITNTMKTSKSVMGR